MIYPKFIQSQETLGICAPSAGVDQKSLASYEVAYQRLNHYFKIIETASVKNEGQASNDAQTRALEFNELVLNPDVKMIMAVKGGDLLMEILPYIDYESFLKHPKFVMGYSDPTSLLLYLTVHFDVATIYGFNASRFAEASFHVSLKNALEIMQGNLLEQHSFAKYEAIRDFDSLSYQLDTENKWWTNKPIVDVKGRLIGGCLDVIRNLLGTKYLDFNEFLHRYPNDEVIYFFDVFQMSALDVYLTMLQMSYAGCFKTTKAIIFGRILFKQQSEDQDYLDLLNKLFSNITLIFNADIGHTNPSMVFINGAYAQVIIENGKARIRQWL